MKHIFYIWQLASLPPTTELVTLCHTYGITAVTIKVLDGTWRSNVPSQTLDAPLIAYINTLRAGGIEVQAWGYHYPSSPGAQGDAIEERRAKLGFDTYLLDVEKEWTGAGMPRAMEQLLDKLKVNGFTVGLNSYRFPSQHPGVPWDKAMNHAAMDWAVPQVYWALRHDPAVQLQQSYNEYQRWGKPFVPAGAAFGATFGGVWWEPTLADFAEYKEWCGLHGVHTSYWWSLDWIVSRQKWDWLRAITGAVDPPAPPPPPEPGDTIVPIGSFTVKSTYRNLRAGPNTDAAVIGNAKLGSVLPYVEEDGEWKKVEAWVWKAANE